MDAAKLRNQNDLSLFNALLQERDIIRVNDQLKQQANEGLTGTRRQLLATSVRLSKNMAPEVHRMLAQCAERLGVTIPIELYVYASPAFNAACVKPENGRLFIMLSSALLEAFGGGELRFVIGHELGHHLYQHHDIPIGYILRGESRPDPKLALRLFAWSRYAEISADRAGAHCAQDFAAVGRALFRLASGLSNEVIAFNIDDFVEQIDDMQLAEVESGQGAPTEDWFSTHPFSPLRVRALKLFYQSELAITGGAAVNDLEVGVQRLMALMEPNYLEGKTQSAEAMRRLFFASAITVMNIDNTINDEEIEVFEKYFGAGSFSEKLDFQRLADEIPERLRNTVEAASIAQRMQVMHDLCVVARAQCPVTEAERSFLLGLANDLALDTAFVEQTLDCSMELD